MEIMKVNQREKRFASATGICDIRYRMWIPEEPRAALQITHGMAEHIDRYSDFAGFLAQNGVLVYGCDMASHGKSLGEGEPRGWFGAQNGWDALVQDMRTLRDIVKSEFPALPYILMGHSMGSFLARSYAGRDGADFEAFIFSGTAGKNPVLGVGKLLARREIKRTGGKLPSQSLYNLSFGSYNRAFKPNRTDSDWLSRDSAQVDKYCADEACGYPFTASGMLDLFTGLGEVSSREWARRVPKKPILIFSGAADPVGGAGRGVRQVAGWLSDTGHAVELKLYKGGRHEMLNEINKEEVYNDVLLFIDAVEILGERE
ncbi:MAG: alpha/beta hydrolase [Clostridia bacterium]|nr:alpha/beta hydrolase [Clostridia bacterium]